MAFKILVMSPLHNMGSSVSAALLTQAIAMNNKTAMLLFTQAESNLPMYLGVENINDPTRSIMQIVRLIDSGALKDKEILDYTFSLCKNGYLMNIANKSLTEFDRTQIVKHIYSRSATNMTVIDNSDDLDTKVTKFLLEASDMIFLVVQPSLKAFQRMKLWLQAPELKDNPNVYVIVACYNEVIFSVRDMAKYIGMPGMRVCKLHYNPWIQKCCITGSLMTVLPLAKDIDPRVANLRNDVEELQQCVDGALVMKNRKGL